MVGSSSYHQRKWNDHKIGNKTRIKGEMSKKERGKLGTTKQGFAY